MRLSNASSRQTASNAPHPDDAGTDSAGAGHYFASADYQTLYRQFGITAAALAAA